MTRFRAAGIHLILSGLIVLTLLSLMFGIWYPNKYFSLMGGGGLIYLISGIDICLGPLLTLVVFKSGKKSLKFDLTVIALVQLAALSYGSYAMFNARPIFTTFANGEFSIATAREVTDAELKRGAKPEWTTRSLTGPVLVAALRPADDKDFESIRLSASMLGYAQFPRLFVSYDSQRAKILKSAKPVSVLRGYDQKNSLAVEQLLKDNKRPEKDFVFVPIASAYSEMSAILDANSAEFITIIDANPSEPVKPKPKTTTLTK